MIAAARQPQGLTYSGNKEGLTATGEHFGVNRSWPLLPVKGQFLSGQD